MFKFSQIEYHRPDAEKLAAELTRIAAELAAAPTYERAHEVYFEAEKLIGNFGTYYTIAHIRHTMDTRNSFYDGEMTYLDEQACRLELYQRNISQAIANSPFTQDFAAEYGPDFVKSIQAQLRLADESVVEYKVQEAKLCQEYSTLVAGCSVNFKGADCNFYGLLKHMLSCDRCERKSAYTAWADMYLSVSARLDDIYDKMVILRKQMAQKLGFDSYAQMAYLANGHYYYGAKEVEAFRKQVVEVVVPAAAELYERQRKRLGIQKLCMYDEQLVFPNGNASPIGDKDYLVESARQMYNQLSPETGEFFNFMVEHELFDLETRPGKHMGGYCTYIQDFGAPFIFSNFNGSSADVDVLTHEAGHAFQAFTAAKRVPLPSLIWSTSDISEIHSMSMEHFTYPWMDKFFGENADKYRYAHLSEALKTVPYLCLVDHFQHEVYANDFTAAQRREAWRKLERVYMPWRDYDGNSFLEGGGYWMQKQHIFLNPFYYVDYALAQMGAFEYYSRAKQNRAATWADYYKLCTLGGSKSYFQLLKEGGLSNPFEEGSVSRAVTPIIKELLSKY